MLRLLLTLALGALLALPGPEAVAIGFGRVGNATVLGQGLNFTVTVRLEGDETISADCVAAEVFSGENRLPSTALRVAIEPGAEPTERILRVSSNSVIDEPVVGVNLQLTCPNRLARKFVAFVDPPLVDLARATTPASAAPAAAAAPQRRSEAPNVRTAVAAAPTAPAAKASAKPAQRSRRAAQAPAGAAPRVVALAAAPLSATAPATATAATSASGARRNAAVARAAQADPGVRLELEAADHAATRDRLNPRPTRTGEPAVAAALSGVAPPPLAPDDDAAQRARERERLVAMEALQESLAKLRAESQATQASLAQIQQRLIEAEQQRHANPLVFGLAALAAALAAVLGVLLWRRAGERRTASAWWSPPAPPAAASLAADEADEADDDWGALERDLRPGPRRPSNAEPALAETTASPMMLSEVHTLAQASAEESQRGFEPAHEMSVEELMDLEQQAEFFIVLGQEEAAIDLLMGHLRSSGGASPLPYLKLLEIYRRRNEREAFERVRERFNRRFNAYAPDWQADPQQGRALLDYAAAVERLQSLWARPAQAMQALEASLFRRDAGTSTFDLPAYRELLLLYSVARDLSEREVAPSGVDLLLPLGGEASDGQPLTRLHPSPPREHAGEVDLDIASLDAGPSENDDRPSRFHTDFSPTSGTMGLEGEPRAKRA